MSYSDALVAAGCEILNFESFGSYQGDWYALVIFDGETGIVNGSYGSCSHCDAFESEFGWSDDEKDNYQERLANFGATYLPVLPISHVIEQLEKRLTEYDWGDEKEILDTLKKWQSELI